MKSVDGKIYIDQKNKRYIKIRNIGYELFSYLNDDGTVSIVGGCVGLDCGWKCLNREDETNEDKVFRDKIRRTEQQKY